MFEALLPPIAVGEIDLGQHELVDEVLTVDTHACVAQYTCRQRGEVAEWLKAAVC